MLHDLLSSRDTLNSLCAQLTADFALHQPAPNSWSIAEIVDHLSISERRASVGIKRTMSQQPASAELLLQTRQVQAILDNHIAVPTRKAQAPDTVRPGTPAWPDALQSFLTQREQSIALFESAGEALNTHVMPHPLLGPMTLAQWFQFTVGHTRRHCLQIESILASR